MSCYIVQEADGVGRIELEDGSGFLVLEACVPTSCYIVQEADGIGRFMLEDGSGFLILENCVPFVPPEPGVGGPLRKGRRRRLEVIGGEEDWLAVVLSEV